MVKETEGVDEEEEESSAPVLIRKQNVCSGCVMSIMYLLRSPHVTVMTCNGRDVHVTSFICNGHIFAENGKIEKFTACLISNCLLVFCGSSG